MATVRYATAVLVLMSWVALLCLDYLWRGVVAEAVRNGTRTYGELYGPLSFFRPLALYTACASSVLCALLTLNRRRE